MNDTQLLKEKIKIELLAFFHFAYLLAFSITKLTLYTLSLTFLYLQENVPNWIRSTKEFLTNQIENFNNREEDTDTEQISDECTPEEIEDTAEIEFCDEESLDEEDTEDSVEYLMEEENTENSVPPEDTENSVPDEDTLAFGVHE